MSEMTMERFFEKLNASASKKAYMGNDEIQVVLAKNSKPKMANKTVKKERGRAE